MLSDEGGSAKQRQMEGMIISKSIQKEFLIIFFPHIGHIRNKTGGKDKVKSKQIWILAELKLPAESGRRGGPVTIVE